jgi:hypothetical protein
VNAKKPYKEAIYVLTGYPSVNEKRPGKEAIYM